MTTFVLGPEGTFSHELALRLGIPDIRLVPTIHRIFEAVSKGEGDGIVPIENSEAGGVGATLDGLVKEPVCITAEMYMPIAHHLAAYGPIEKIKKIYVHPQTHEQCSERIEQWGIPVIHTESNAQSAVRMKGDVEAGAIVSSFAVVCYRLPVIAADVQNNPDNITRFVRIAKEPCSDEHAEKCSIIIDPSGDRTGLLHDLLAVFAVKKINLTRIESRPSKRGMGNYVFFLDYAMSPGYRDAITYLKTMTGVKELGCYRRLEVPE
ncbi:MAG: Prephenate dehydratase [Methanoregula sp. PtaU1.Bin051]|nr:MAG: Prephenate dehydratase [Methanoregula sp. PtaU1.Bin051]